MKDARAVIVLRDGADVAEALRRLAPLGLRQVDSAQVAGALRAVHPDPVIPDVYLVHGTEGLRPAGAPTEQLSRREQEMLQLIASGLSNEEIAGRLYLSRNSVKSYVRSAYRKIGVTRRTQAAMWWVEHGAFGQA